MPMKSSEPLITTIIPTFRRPALLGRAIRSVLNQTFPHFQVCVYDNASGDATAEVVQEFMQKDPRVTYYCHPENIGAGANFNYGLMRVETPFFSFLSDDDILLPEFYETTLEGFKNYPEAAFAAGSVIAMTEKGQVVSHQLSTWPRYGYYAPPDGLLEMLGYKHPMWTGVLFRREIISAVGQLDEVGPLSDMDYELRIAAHFPFVLLEKPCAIFVHHSTSLSTAPYTDMGQFWPGFAKMIVNLDKVATLPLPIKIYCCRQILKYAKRHLFGTGFLINKNYQDAYKCAATLERYFKDRMRSRVLYSIIKLTESYPKLLNILRYRDNYRKMISKGFSRHLQEKYDSYTRYLVL